MSKKNLALWATIMIIVFGGTILIYPMIFSPSEETSGMGEPIAPVPETVKP